MHFEFDPVKSKNNQEKHGIDFIEAQALWLSSVLELPLRTEDENRLAVIGQIDGKFWTAIITYRQGKIRIISVRRSRYEEKEIYQKKAKDHLGGRT